MTTETPTPDLILTASSFGGGWVQPFTADGEAICLAALDFGGGLYEAPLWPQGHIVEPYEIEGLAETCREYGAIVEVR